MDGKLMDVLLDSLSTEDLETLLKRKRKKNTIKAANAMTKKEKWTEHYKNEIIKYGVLHPPRK